MNKRNYPSYIHIANFKDIFWNNNSDLYPTSTPGIDLYTKVEKTRPTFHSPYIGTCILDGEFNHCVYDGKYYFLTKVEVIDIAIPRYKYQLDYDVMMNFMSAGGGIKGTLSKTNDPSILETCLQTAKPILADPGELHVFNTEKSSTNWVDNLEVNYDIPELIKNFKLAQQWVLKKDFDDFISRVNDNPLGKAAVDKEWLPNKHQTDRYVHTQTIDPFCIIDAVKTSFIPSLWKVLILDKLRSFTSEKSNFTITKFTSATDHFHNGKHVVSIRNKSLGAKEDETVALDRIDLSTLEDIVPLDNRVKDTALEPATVCSINHLGTLSAEEVLKRNPWLGSSPSYKSARWIFDPHPFSGPLALIQRKYLPLPSLLSKERFNYPAPTIPRFFDYEDKIKWRYSPGPQVLLFKTGHVGGLFYQEKGNVAIVPKQIDTPTLSASGGRVVTASTSTYDDHYTWWPYMYLNYADIPSMGFLMFQASRPRSQFNGPELITDELTHIQYRVGLNLERYKAADKSKFWGYASERLLFLLAGNHYLARALLDLDLFTWLAIFPSEDNLPYKYYSYDAYDIHRFFPQAGNREKWYPSRLQHMDISYPGGIIKAPFSEARIQGWLTKREQLLDEISIYESIAVGGGFSESDMRVYPFAKLKKGDLFFTGLEYASTPIYRPHLDIPFNLSLEEWNNIDYKKFYHSATSAEKKGLSITDFDKNVWAPYSLMGQGAGDFIGGGEHAHLLPNVGGALYIFRGEFKLGVGARRTLVLALSDDPLNDVQSVGGRDTFTPANLVIRPCGEALDYKNNPVVDEVTKTQFATLLLSILSGAENGRIHYYTEESINVGVHTFDLVGTDWYLVFVNGNMGLLPKKEDQIVSKTRTSHNINVNFATKPHTYEKINQKAEFLLYGQSIPLNTKFTFDNHRFHFNLTPIALKNEYADPDVEYQHLEVNSPNDFINVWLTIPKKETRSAEKVDSAQLMLLKEKIMARTTNYEQERYKNELLLGDKRLAMARQREDLDFQHNSAVANIALKGVGMAIGGAVGLATGVGGGMVAAGMAAGAASMKSDIETLIRYPTLMSRIGEDERNLLLANAQAMYERKQNYEHDFRIQTLKLNQYTNSFVTPGVTNRDAQEAFNKINNYTDINIQVRLPYLSQFLEISHIYDTFGCECVSDWYLQTPLQIQNGMRPGLYRFSKLEVGGVESPLTDPTILDIVRQIFENGTKFMHVEHIPLQSEEVTVVVHKDAPKPEFDKKKLNEWTRELWDVYKINTPKKDIIDTIKQFKNWGLTDQEYQTYKDKIRTDTDEHLLDDISKIISGREGGTVIQIGAQPTQEQQDRARLEEELNALKGKISTLETNITSIEAEKVKLEDEIEARKLSSKLAADKTSDLERQLRECIRDKTNIIQARDTCDLINSRKIKELEKQLKDAKDELKVINDDLTDKKDKLRIANEQLEQAHADLLRCENVEKKAVEDELKLLKEKTIPDLQSKNDALTQEIAALRAKAPAGAPAEDMDKYINDYRSLVQTQCNVTQTMIDSGYDIDIKERDDGGNALRDLVMEILLELKWMRRAGIDTKLSTKYQPMQKIFDLIYKIEEIPLVEEWESILFSNNYVHYKKMIAGERGYDNDKAQSIKRTIDFNKTKYETPHTAYGLKALLDELNFQCYETHKALKKQLETDTDLQYMFAHVYPGKTLPLYKELFGDPNIALKRNIYKKYYTCPLLEPADVEKEQFKYNTLALLGYGLQTELGTDITTLPDRQEDRKEGMYIHPKIVVNGKELFLSTNIEDITVFYDPKYLPDNFDRAQVEYIYPMWHITDYKKCYELDGRNYSWKYMYAAITPTTSSASLGVYFWVDRAGIWNAIKTKRQHYWDTERKPLKLRKPIEEYDWDRYISFLYWDKDGIFRSYVRKINLLDIFGSFYVLDAAFLFALLKCFSTNYSWKRYENYGYLRLEMGYGFTAYDKGPLKRNYQLSSVSDRKYNMIDSILVEKTTPSEWQHRRTYYCNLEFNSLLSVLNYIWRHIKLDLKTLADPLGPDLSKSGLGPLMDKVYREQSTC